MKVMVLSLPLRQQYKIRTKSNKYQMMIQVPVDLLLILLVQRLYGLAPVAKYLVRDEDGMSLGPYLALLQDNVILASWAKMKNVVLEGGVPFFKAHGLQVRHFEINSEDLRYNQVCNDAMANHSSIFMKKILKIYQGFKDVKVLVDVGGGLGHTLKIILSKYHNIKGINFDLPHVMQNGILYDGIDQVGGDVFESVPSGDVILLKASLMLYLHKQFSLNH
ncbi:hypothetical protein Droror1_Dr00004824 [Drosera rotundifolia]